MTAPRFKLGIGTLAIAGAGLVIAAGIGGLSVLVVNAHRAALLDQLTRGADQLSETIASTTYYDMLENRRPAVHREIVTIGRQKGIEKVRLFNALGTIMFSSDESEIGRSLDKRAEACYGCHAAGQPLQKLSTRERTRIYRTGDGRRVLGMIRPIHNEQSCWTAACHAHGRDEAVLGVLDVNLSLAEADRRIAGDQRRFALFAVLAIAATSALLWWLSESLILRPVAELIAGTRRVAEGDLHTPFPATAPHELGDLARAFNDMIRRLGDAQRQLVQADKLASIGRLAAGVAHEINNPLTGVLTYASLLQVRCAEQPEVAADLDVIVRETKRCREIVRGLLDFARPSPPQHGPTDLNEVVRRAVAVVMNQLALSRVRLDFQLAPALRPVPADANQIEQVVVNLVMNAADALGAQGGTIRITTAEASVPPRGEAADAGGPRPFAELVVEDSGAGIAASDLDHLFEPFFTTKGNRGLGLGLAVTWGIVEAHGGTIDVQSEPGHGARFTVRLPLAAPAMATGSASSAAASAGEAGGTPRVEHAAATGPAAVAPVITATTGLKRTPERKRGAA
jgi:two-component system NtrC family sensor kinase